MTQVKELLDKFSNGLRNHDHQAMADCYHSNATFKDIAFDLPNKKMIHAMWHFIAESDIRLLSFDVDQVNSNSGTANWSAEYTFRDTGRRVHNNTRSSFEFEGGLIVKQVDAANPWNWCLQALGPVKGRIAWLIPAIRRRKAMGKLKSFIRSHPQYE